MCRINEFHLFHGRLWSMVMLHLLPSLLTVFFIHPSLFLFFPPLIFKWYIFISLCNHMLNASLIHNTTMKHKSVPLEYRQRLKQIHIWQCYLYFTSLVFCVVVTTNQEKCMMLVIWGLAYFSKRNDFHLDSFSCKRQYFIIFYAK